MYLNDKLYITAAYIGEITEFPEFNSDEISEIKWISEEELNKFEFSPEMLNY